MIVYFALQPLCFISNLKFIAQEQNIHKSHLSIEELQKWESVWIKSVQRRFVKDKSNLTQLQIKFWILLDEESIWRYKGRLLYLSLSEKSAEYWAALSVLTSKSLNIVDALWDWINSIKFSTIPSVYLKNCVLPLFVAVVMVMVMEGIPKHLYAP